MRAPAIVPILGLLGLACTAGDRGQHDDAMAATSDEEEGEGDGDGDGDGGRDACNRYVACAEEATPDVSPTVFETYGPDGTCWESPAKTEEGCEIECRGAMGGVRASFPDIDACWECESDGDCTALGWGPTCFDDHSCVDLTDKCGDGGLGCQCLGGTECTKGDCEQTGAGTRCVLQSAEGGAPGTLCAAGQCEPGCVCSYLVNAPSIRICIVP